MLNLPSVACEPRTKALTGLASVNHHVGIVRSGARSKQLAPARILDPCRHGHHNLGGTPVLLRQAKLKGTQRTVNLDGVASLPACIQRRAAKLGRQVQSGLDVGVINQGTYPCATQVWVEEQVDLTA